MSNSVTFSLTSPLVDLAMEIGDPFTMYQFVSTQNYPGQLCTVYWHSSMGPDLQNNKLVAVIRVKPKR